MDADALPGESEAGAVVTEAMRQWAHRSAADYLSKHASSVENLRKVMLRRAGRRHPELGRSGAEALAQEALGFCRTHAFVDDAAYAGMKVRSGLRKGQSRRRIAASLSAKGVDRETSAEALAGADDLAAAAVFARRRRFGPWTAGADDPEARRRQAGALARAGFAGDTVFAVLRLSLEEAEAAIAAADKRA